MQIHASGISACSGSGTCPEPPGIAGEKLGGCESPGRSFPPNETGQCRTDSSGVFLDSLLPSARQILLVEPVANLKANAARKHRAQTFSSRWVPCPGQPRWCVLAYCSDS